MTYRALCSLLSDAGVDTPQTDARLLLSHFFGVDAAQILAFPEREYEGDAFAQAVNARTRRVPLQHLLKEAYFYDECYEVSADCLIPRTDTELLIEEACRLLPSGARFADFCTGSGCIALSVLLHREDLSALAVDTSAPALAIARRNAERFSMTERVSFEKADLLCFPYPFSCPDYILSNPPYIRSCVLPTLAPEIAYEPRIALDGGEDGLCFYRAFLAHLSPKLFLFEIGFDQADALRALGAAHGYAATVKKDLGGRDRLVILKKN